MKTVFWGLLALVLSLAGCQRTTEEPGYGTLVASASSIVRDERGNELGPVSVEIYAIPASEPPNATAMKFAIYENQKFMIPTETGIIAATDIILVKLDKGINETYPWMESRPELQVYSEEESRDLPTTTIWATNRTAMVIAESGNRPGCFHTLIDVRIDGGGFLKGQPTWKDSAPIVGLLAI